MSEGKLRCQLVGGQSHGSKVDIDDGLNSIEVPVYEGFDGQTNAGFSETYTRRELDIEGEGDKWVYFGHGGDDDVETEALALRLRSQDNSG